MGFSSAWFGRIAVVISLGVLSACEQPGYSSRDTEWDRRTAGPYFVVNANRDRAVISALGRQVAIEPAKGFCLAEDSIETSGRSAFALIGDCTLEEGGTDAPRDSRGALQLPRSIPGIITVSVSGDPGFDRGAAPLSDLSTFLETPEGKRLLGRSGDGAAVEILDTRRIGNAVFVLVEDGGDPVVPVLDQRFWRAFVEVNDRLAVVTVSGFRAMPMGKEQMLEHLVEQVQTLSVANAAPINETPDTEFAERRRQRRAAAGAVAVGDLQPTSVIVAAEEAPPAAVDDSPEPPDRPVTAQAQAEPEAPEADTVAVAELSGQDETPGPAAEPAAVIAGDTASGTPATTTAATEPDADLAPSGIAPEEAPEAPAKPAET